MISRSPYFEKFYFILPLGFIEWIGGGMWRHIVFIYKKMSHFIKSWMFLLGSQLLWCVKNKVKSIIKLIIQLLKCYRIQSVTFHKHAHNGGRDFYKIMSFFRSTSTCVPTVNWKVVFPVTFERQNRFLKGLQCPYFPTRGQCTTASLVSTKGWDSECTGLGDGLLPKRKTIHWKLVRGTSDSALA